MAGVKYVAEGFTSDAQKLLKEFTDCGSLEFDSFSNLWKKHNFGLIFMGRPTEKEFREFVNEIYELTINYLDSKILELKVGAIYLLYALFINQNIVSPIYIRITPYQYQILLNILDIAEKKKIATLHYVIDYLLDNCLEYVAFPSMFGPCSKKTRKDSKSCVQDEMFLADIDEDLVTLHESNILDEIKAMQLQYQNLKENLDSQRGKSCTDTVNKVEDFKNQLACLINVNQSAETESDTSSVKIGCKRKHLKETQFKQKVIGRYGISNDYGDEPSVQEAVNEPSPSKSIKGKRKVRVRKPPEERRMGRPKKFPEILRSRSKGCTKQVKFKFEPSVVQSSRRGPIGRKRVSYLKPYNVEVKIMMDGDVSDLEEFSEENSNNEGENHNDGYENYDDGCENSDEDHGLTF